MTALDEIKQLYFNTTEKTVQRDLDRAIDLLKAMSTDEEREKAAVWNMDGLSEMRSEWGVKPQASGQSKGNKPRRR